MSGPQRPAADGRAYTARIPTSLSIVIPVLNEENEIPRILAGAQEHLSNVAGSGRSSSSTTRARTVPSNVPSPSSKTSGSDSFVTRSTAARASRSAGGCSKPEVICVSCAMPTVSPRSRSLPLLEKATEEVDVAVGSRLSAGARVSRQQPIRRRIVGFGFITLTRVVMGRLPHDVYCGFKLWRAEAAQQVFERVHLDGWAFDAEALAMARRLGYDMREVGIEWTNRPDSRLSIRDVLLPVTRELLAARSNVRRAAAEVRNR